MKKNIALLSLLSLFACQSPKQPETVKYPDTLSTKKDLPQYEDPYDSLEKVQIDTSSTEGKRTWIMHRFLIDNQPSAPTYDSLFDLNYDGHEDYVIGYYGQSGTGIKNRAEVYLFNKKKNSYQRNEQLSTLPNPSFYINEKKITGFYLPHGAGSGSQLEWIDGKWITTKEFKVNNEEEKSVWHIFYPLTRKKDSLVLPYEMLPPKEILESKIE